MPAVGVSSAQLACAPQKRPLHSASSCLPELPDEWQWERTGEAAWELEPSKVADAEQEATSDEDEDGHCKPRLGDGVRGHGPPLTSSIMGQLRGMCDGFGLCSPGRWPPERRKDSKDVCSLGFLEELGGELENLLCRHSDVQQLASSFADGKVVSCPFSAALIQEGRDVIFKALDSVGPKLPVRERTVGQPLYLAAIEELLRIAGDPDHKAFFSSSVSFAKGVRLGVGVKNPRVPAIFERKTKWRKYPEECFAEGCDRENYLSAKEHALEVQEQFLAEAEEGAMVEIPLSEAIASYGPKLSIASLGAIEKKDGSYRVVHDGTHGVNINAKIKLRDQLRNPTAGDLCSVLKYMPQAAFGLTGDIKRAHRLAKVAEQDWGYQACRSGARGPEWIWLNKVGTFGICSAAYHWSRLMGGLGRLIYYMWGKAALWQLIFVDDLLWLAKQKSGAAKIILAIFIYVLLGVPFAWKKFVGGPEFTWVGFAVNVRVGALGLSESRATWAINWLQSTAVQGLVRVADMRAALGRLSFALSALGHLRPFLGPIYAWVAVLDSCRRYQLPKAIILIMQFLAKALRGLGRLTPVGAPVACEKELFRTDARAEGDEVWIGGWALDHADTKKCRWFAERLSHINAPWLYTSGESYRQIASLELLATLAAVVVFDVPEASKCSFRCSAATDNMGNSHVVSRLLTTKFPLNAFLMELAVQLQKRGAELHLFWLPRLQNVEADALTNNDTARFEPSLRVRFDLTSFKGALLHDFLDAGTQLYQEIKKTKAARVSTKVQKIAKSDTLRVRDPW